MTSLDKFGPSAAQAVGSQRFSNAMVGTLLLFVLIGGFFRFNNLSQKFPWMDECITQIRVSEYVDSPIASFPDAIATPISVANLKGHLEEKPQHTLAQLLDRKLSHIPEHPPLYYLLGAKAASLFGNRIAVLRGVSACISLLTFPAIYWLCLELFGSSLYGVIGIGIASICPLYILYAQEAREYSLWIVAGMVSSAALLRSLRTNRRIDWFAYGLSLILGLYTHLFFTLNILAHVIGGLFCFLKDKAYFKSRWLNFAAMLALNILAFVPWGLLFFSGSARVERHAQWFSGSFNILTVTKRVAGSVVRILYDNGFSDQSSLNTSFTSFISVYLPLILVLVLIGCSLTSVLRMPNSLASVHIASLVIVPLVVIVLGEALTGKVLTQTRYLMPVLLGVQLALVFFVGLLLAQFVGKSVLNPISKVLVSGVVVASLLSCLSITNVEFWWNKGSTRELSLMAELVEGDRSLILSGINHLPSITRLVYQLDPLTAMQFSADLNTADPADIEHLYYLGNSEDVIAVSDVDAGLNPLFSLTPEFTLYTTNKS